MNRILFFLFGLILFSACSRPVTRFSFDTTERVAPVNIKFTNNSENADRYEWDFGDGNTSTAAAPEHRYIHSGNYIVKLKAYKGNKMTSKEETVQIKPPTACLVEVQTAFGNMLIKLFDETPKHRDNFLKLAEQGFFDDLLFHRVIEGFMIQGGDPMSRGAEAGAPLGSGGPGYTVDAEMRDELVHIKGSLAAARTSDNVNPERKSSGSQFYIVQGRSVTSDMLDTFEAQKGKRYNKQQREDYTTHGGTPFLDYDYTVFGRVIEGLDVIDKIAAVETGRSDRPVKDVKFKIVVIK